jgi:pyruvate dehydrogenase E2 component (dihydrolipoamide acetyltransferase)
MTITKFALPDLGEGLVEATVIHWHVPVGGTVGMDETLVEVETAKAVTEIPSPVAGTVLQHGGSEGEVMSVGELLALIGDPADAATDPPGGAAVEPATATDAAAPIVGSLVDAEEELPPIQVPVTQAAERPAAMPPIRKLAKELGVDLTTVHGSGPGRRISRSDVEAHAKANRAPAGAEDERVPMSALRRTIAANMLRSWSEIPHVTAFDEVDATRLLAVRTALRARHGADVPIDALLVAAAIPALRAIPVFNASLDGDDLIFHHRHDIGVAVDTPDGVIVAVIQDVDAKGVLELAAEIARLGDAARARTLQHTEASGQTFTVTNIGAAGGSFGTPLVPYGTVAILSAGRAKERAVARDGQVAVAPVMPLSLSYDHRVADGAVGRHFLALLVETLTEPALLLA